MKSSILLFCGVFATNTAQVCLAQQSDNGTFSTPAYNGTGGNTSSRSTSRFGTTGTGATRTNANVNFGTSLGRTTATNLGTTAATNLGTIIGQPNGTVSRQGGTVMTPGSTAISPADATNAVTPLGAGTVVPPLDATNTTTGVPNSSVGIGQQSTTAIGQQGTIGIGQQKTTALGQQGTGAAITPQTNGFVINADGTVTAAPAQQQGGSAEAGLSGTNFGRSFGTNRFGTNRFGTNQFRR
jgi:hypothetical protein